MTTTTNAQLAAQVTAALQKVNEREAQYREWLAGTVSGGPNKDGRYPITNMSGETFLLDSLARVVDLVGGPAALSRQAQLLSEAARDAAVTAQQRSEQIGAVVSSAKTEVYAARDITKLYRDEAAASAYNLQVTRDATDSMRESAQLARDEAVQARDDSVAAKGVTLTARAEAVTARDDAQRFAASINPTLLATKADLSTELAKLVGQSPTTLDTLQELAAALGNNPNFATTMTTQLSQKAALNHTHGMADITGLQTALDGKAAVGHGHTIANITGLQAALDAKQAAGAYLPLSGGTITGFLSVEASLEVRSQGPEGGQIVMKKGSQMTTGGDVYIDTLTTGVRFYDNNGTTYPYFFFDLVSGNIASPKGTFWNQGNMGAGSGMNADMVDGKHAADFATAGHTHADLPLTGGTLTGPLTLNTGANQILLGADGAIELTRAAGGAYIDFKDSTSEDWDVRLQANGGALTASGNFLAKDIIASRGDGTGVIFLNAATSRYLYFDGGNYIMPGAELYVNGTRVWRSGTIDTNTWHTSGDGKNRFHFTAQGRSYFGSPDGYEWRSAADAEIMALNGDGSLYVENLLTIRSTGGTAGVRFWNNSTARDWRMIQKDNGQLMVTHESAGAEVCRFRVDNWVEVPYGIVAPNVVGGHSGSFSGDITWNNSVNIYVPGESSFDVAAGGVWSVWDGGFAIRVSAGSPVVIGEVGNRGLYVAGTLTASGDVTAFSDARLKTDVRTITGALEIVQRLRGVRFVKDGRENLGVIAQEVQEVLPELIHEQADGTLAVALPNLVGVLIEAVKELAEARR
jgi:hypothetical protein